MSQDVQGESRGERRRRREAEAAARRAAGGAGEAPLTRKELRRRALEEKARLEAIATGELPLVDAEGRELSPEEALRLANAGEPGGEHGGPAGAAPETDAEPAETDAAQRSDAEQQTDAQPTAPLPETARETDAKPQSEPEAAGPNRRAMRERFGAMPPAATSPGERTATGRRPVVRAPHVARGMRTLDATGTMTGVQPIIPDGPEAEVTTDPSAWESAVALPVIRDDEHTIRVDVQSAETPGQGQPTPATSVEPSETSEPTAGSTNRPGEPDDAEPGDAEPGADTAVAAQGDNGDDERRELTDDAGPDDAEPIGSGSIPVPRWSAVSAASPDRGSDAARRLGGATSSAPSGPEAYAASVLDEDEDDDEGLRPTWSPVSGFSAPSSSSPAEAPEGSRRERRERPERPRSIRERLASATSSVSAASGPDPVDDDPAYVEEMRPRNPAASVVRVVALILAAIVIGLLIGLLAFGPDGDGGDDGAVGEVPAGGQDVDDAGELPALAPSA